MYGATGKDGRAYSRIVLGAIREAGIRHFGIRVHGADEYPPKLRDAQHPIELLYFQGNWDITHSRCVAIIGTRHPTEAGKRGAAKLMTPPLSRLSGAYTA